MKVLLLGAICFVTVCSISADLEWSSSEVAHKKSSHSSKGGGDKENGQSYEEHKHTHKKEKGSVHDKEEGSKGESLKSNHKVDDEEGGGKKTEYHDENSHKLSHDHHKGSKDGAKFSEGKKNKKLNFKKGFREKYHRDEMKKHGRFFSNADKSGEYEIFGNKHSKHSSNSGFKKRGGNFKKSNSQDNYGKKSAKHTGHQDGDKKGYSQDSGKKSHHEHDSKWGKKSESSGGKEYHFEHPKKHW